MLKILYFLPYHQILFIIIYSLLKHICSYFLNYIFIVAYHPIRASDLQAVTHAACERMRNAHSKVAQDFNEIDLCIV